MKKIKLIICAIISLFFFPANILASSDDQSKNIVPILQLLLLQPSYNCQTGICWAWFSQEDVPKAFRLPNSTRQFSIAQEVFSDLYPVLFGFETRYAVKLGSSELRCSKTEQEVKELYKTREPVLFIHGYQRDNKFGGGEEYWGNFLKLIDELDNGGRRYLSFDFCWRTNARFQDVAEDLYYAVKYISSAMENKKVHIVAHSFGGILARTMLQGILPENVTISTPGEYIASLTTIGTPHSGIADESKVLAGALFPKGQDSIGFEAANQISVHQMGESTLHNESPILREAVKVYQVGEIAAALADLENHPLPNNLPVQVAIGLVAITNPLTEMLHLQEGDHLISYLGQRFHPELTVFGIKPLLTNQNAYLDSTGHAQPMGAVVTETLLGLGNDDLQPGYEAEHSFFWARYPGFGGHGYIHSPGTALGYEKGVHYSFIESHVDCALADTCNHASFLAVKDWLNKYSSATVAKPYLQLTMQLVDSNDPTMGLPASADSFRTFKIGSGGDREEVEGIYDTEYLRIPFSPDTQYEIEISIDGYQTKTVTFLSKAYIDQPSYPLGTVTLDSISIPPPSQLNDTGITWGGDYPEGNNTTCTSNIDAPQDCHQGRDATHNDNSDGHGGFSYTKLDQSGNSLPATAATWSCVRDNVTGLVWEGKTDDGGIHDKDNTYRWGGKTALGTGYGTYYPDWDTLVDGSNSERLCGYSDWRVPTRAELQGLVHYGRTNPAIDTDYFPNTVLSYFWSASPYAYSSDYASGVRFYYGYAYNFSSYRSYGNHIRLVRSGQ